MPFFKAYRPGMEVGRGQSLDFATRVTLLEESPERLLRENFETLVNQPVPIEEWLLLTTDYLVYCTETPVMDHLRAILLRGARQVAPETMQELLSHLSEHADSDASRIWLPRRGAQARPWVFEGRAPALLGSKPVPVHYYEIRVATGALYLLQQPIGRKKAKRDFEELARRLRAPGAVES